MSGFPVSGSKSAPSRTWDRAALTSGAPVIDEAHDARRRTAVWLKCGRRPPPSVHACRAGCRDRRASRAPWRIGGVRPLVIERFRRALDDGRAAARAELEAGGRGCACSQALSNLQDNLIARSATTWSPTCIRRRARPIASRWRSPPSAVTAAGRWRPDRISTFFFSFRQNRRNGLSVSSNRFCMSSGT